jgi:hypothetical protein
MPPTPALVLLNKETIPFRFFIYTRLKRSVNKKTKRYRSLYKDRAKDYVAGRGPAAAGLAEI